MSLLYETKLIKRASCFQRYYFLFFNFLYCIGVYPINNSVIVLVSLVAQSCLTLFDPMDYSMPGFPVHHQLLEFTQTHARQVGDAIQPSHPLSSPSPPAFNHSQHQGFFR